MQLRPGSIVAILYGGPLPVLLREAPGQLDSLGRQQYRLIGDAFCHVPGVADGEAMDNYGKPSREFVF